MLFIGSISLTPESPGPVTIDVETLTKQEAFQFLFNINKGVLTATGDLGLLESKLSVEVTTTKIETPVIDEIDASLKKILSKRISTIKKETASLSIADLKKVIKLEQKGKNRKSVINFLDGLYATHTEQVAKTLKSLQDNSGKGSLDAQTFLDDLPDVLELKEEEVEFTLPDKE